MDCCIRSAEELVVSIMKKLVKSDVSLYGHPIWLEIDSSSDNEETYWSDKCNRKLNQLVGRDRSVTQCQCCGAIISSAELCDNCAKDNDPFTTVDNCGKDYKR